MVDDVTGAIRSIGDSEERERKVESTGRVTRVSGSRLLLIGALADNQLPTSCLPLPRSSGGS